MNKSPAFQFYPQHYLASSRVAEMSLEEEGVYIRLLCYCWTVGSIPADPERCARLAGKGCSVETATIVQRAFNKSPTDSTRLVHDRLDVERNRQEKRRKKASEAGKKSSQVRQKQSRNIKASKSLERRLNERSTNVELKPNTSSSDTETHTQALPVVADATSVVTVGKSEPAPANFVAEQFVAWFGGSVHVTDKRRKALQQRWKDPWWRENWQAALERAAQSPFLRGETSDRGWQITLDFFLKPDSVTKILEGTYDGSHQPNRSQPQTAAERREALNAASFDWLRRAAAEQQREKAAASRHIGNDLPASS